MGISCSDCFSKDQTIGSDIIRESKEKNDQQIRIYRGDIEAAVKTKNAQKVKLVVGKGEAVFKDSAKLYICNEHYGIIGEVSEGNQMKSKVLTPKCMGIKILMVDEKQAGLWVFKEFVDRESFERGLLELEIQVDAVERRKCLKT